MAFDPSLFLQTSSILGIFTGTLSIALAVFLRLYRPDVPPCVSVSWFGAGALILIVHLQHSTTYQVVSMVNWVVVVLVELTAFVAITIVLWRVLTDRSPF